MSLLAEEVGIVDLLLDLGLVGCQGLQLALVLLPLLLIVQLFVLDHRDVDLRVLLL